MFMSMFKKQARAFAEDTRGYISLEAMIVMPVLLWLFGASWVYFDVMRQQGINQKANYVIGDALSRQTDPVGATYLQNSHNLLQTLTKTTGTESDLRVTVVSYTQNGNSNNGQWKVEWSFVVGNQSKVTNGDLSNYTDRLPVVASGEQLVVVETWDDYAPVFDIGLVDPFEITTYSFTRPRYAPQILYAQGGENNGWGNGDQDAPGASLCSNNAENQTDCTAPLSGI